MASNNAFPARLFGTDGVRGPANRGAMTPAAVVSLGRSAARVLGRAAGGNGSRLLVVVGRDSRLSGTMLESALAAGLASAGVDVALAGVLPTPAVASLIRSQGASFGAVISASHNPPVDNGIKFFNHEGYKPDDREEGEIERLARQVSGDAFDDDCFALPDGLGCGRVEPLADGAELYIEESLAVLDGQSLAGLRIVVDPGHGAAGWTSPEALRRAGAEVLAFHDQPDGARINVGCGCTHPAVLRGLVMEQGADVGIAHDGDADRVVLCDETGEVLDGDEIMAILALDLLAAGRLQRSTLVTTVMTNQGLAELLGKHKAGMIRTPVGDRHVISEMRQSGYNLGGEQSGHIILHDHNTTGDGLAAALAVLRVMRKRGARLSELRTCMTRMHQARRDFPVRSKPPVEELDEAMALMTETEQELKSSGRILLRYSGTEALIRLLIEGLDGSYIERRADLIAAAIQRQIGIQS